MAKIDAVATTRQGQKLLAKIHFFAARRVAQSVSPEELRFNQNL